MKSDAELFKELSDALVCASNVMAEISESGKYVSVQVIDCTNNGSTAPLHILSIKEGPVDYEQYLKSNEV